MKVCVRGLEPDVKSHNGDGLKADSLSRKGTVYTDGRNNMHLGKRKLETSSGVFSNTRESFQSDAINGKTLNETDVKEKVARSRLPDLGVVCQLGLFLLHSQGVALSQEAHACTRFLRPLSVVQHSRRHLRSSAWFTPGRAWRVK